MTPEEHLDAEHLVRLATEGLPGDQREAALSHLEVCGPCGDRLAAILLLRQGQRRGARRAWVPVAAVAATVVMVAALWMLASFPGSEPAPESLSPERQALVDRWAEFASKENLDERLYTFVMKVFYPETMPVSPGHHLPKTRAAIVDLQNGRYDPAIKSLVRLHFTYPDFDTISGWLGIALHLSGETDPEVGKLFERCAQAGISTLRDACVWYGAQHFLLAARPEEAIPKLRLLSGNRDHIGRMAKAFLEQLPLDELDLDEESQE